jgi:3-deoxy-D-manno-octulosonic-acid transferase
MFKQINNKKITLLLLNARFTKKTFNKWMTIKNFSKEIFGKISFAYPQNLETKSYLKKIGIKNIKSIGNIKFAENPEEKLIKINKKLKLEFNKKKVWVASSTHQNEEIFCAEAHVKLKRKIKNLITVIIPRHIHRVNQIISQLEKFNLKILLHSSNKYNLNDIDIYIVDTFGETKKFHKIATSVFLGGSIIKRGGQNPLEAARFGSRIIHGPNTDNFADIYKLLKTLKISEKIDNPTNLASTIVFKKNKKIGYKIKKMGEKILNETIKELDKQINNEFKKA